MGIRSVLMIEQILIGISKSLNTHFKEHCIYVDSVKQGLQEPCFTIRCKKQSEKKMLGNRYYSVSTFEIVFYPKGHENGEYEMEMNEIGRKLYSCLGYLFTDGVPLKASKLNYEIKDTKLHFFVDFSIYLIKKEETAEDDNQVMSKAEIYLDSI